ncbi:MAG: hypothetical protein H6843_13885 [Rhodospirillaceae bacterium]|nr:hypothetical protein [Rhodospirillaceae bacterium]
MNTGSDFNIASLASDPALREKLIAQAENGNDSVNTPFVQSAARRQHASRSEDATTRDAIQMMEMTAAQQRLADRIAELDEAALRALEANERALEEAWRRHERLLERAHVVTLADGTDVRVFRDGDDVRLEGGSLVDPSVIEADGIPSEATTWEQFEESSEQISALVRERQAIEDYRGTLSETEEFLDTDPDDAIVADLEAGLMIMPDAVRGQLPDRPSGPQADGPTAPADTVNIVSAVPLTGLNR